MKAILTKMTILMGKPIMLGYKRLHGRDLNEHDNFRNGKLIIHGYRMFAWGDLNGNEHFKIINYSFDLLGSKD